MAATGTATALFSETHKWEITILGVTQGSTSQQFDGKSLPFSSFVLQGTFGAGASCQWQGSNDGGTTWVNIGVAVTTTATGGTITPGGVVYRRYRLNVTGGDGTTSINAYVAFSPSY